jgi:hypothetical protein
MDLARRYGCDVRTIDRDHASGVLPPGRYRRGKARPIWYLDEIEAREKIRSELKRKMEFAKRPAPPVPKVVQLTFALPLK